MKKVFYRIVIFQILLCSAFCKASVRQDSLFQGKGECLAMMHMPEPEGSIGQDNHMGSNDSNLGQTNVEGLQDCLMPSLSTPTNGRVTPLQELVRRRRAYEAEQRAKYEQLVESAEERERKDVEAEAMLSAKEQEFVNNMVKEWQDGMYGAQAGGAAMAFVDQQKNSNSQEVTSGNDGQARESQELERMVSFDSDVDVVPPEGSMPSENSLDQGTDKQDDTKTDSECCCCWW